LAGLFLLVALVATGFSGGPIHAHADGDHDHDHLAQAASATPPGPSLHDKQPAPPDQADVVFHAHDVGTTTPALSALPVLLLVAIAPAQPVIHPATATPPSAARRPPHRPPIA